jgi:hypothetical protein
MARRTDDECHLFVAPMLVGGGKRIFPDDVYQPLKLLDERRFGNGMVFLRYTASRRVTGGRGAANMEPSTLPVAGAASESGGGYRP